MAHHRRWTDDQLARMQKAVEGGVYVSVVATRFSIGAGTIWDLIKRHGWTVPGAPPISKTQASAPAKRPPSKPVRTFYLQPNRAPFTPKENGCAVRILKGAEFLARKAELEARDRKERERAQA